MRRITISLSFIENKYDKFRNEKVVDWHNPG